jgi:hypothetical protein
MKSNRSTVLSVALATFAALAPVPAARADDAPPWLRQAAALSLPAYPKYVPAVVLVDEAQMTVNEDGRLTTVTRGAVRVLAREGRDVAIAKAVYQPDTDKVKDIRAWHIPATGQPRQYGKGESVDMATSTEDVYNESRMVYLSLRDEVEAGSVFGYEVTTESKSVFTQHEWSFQGRNPVVSSKLTLSLPDGWTARSVTFNHAPVEPAVSGSTYSWELRSLPFIDNEPSSPPTTMLAPRLAISYYPADGKRTNAGPSFTTWSEVSKWLSELSDPQATPDATMTAKAQSLVAGAKTELERIQAIGRYVQGVKYISIQTGLGRGGGYRPHLASEVFAKSYGDCKDKANLMRAMLSAVGITSFPMPIFSGDPSYVREEWPTPQQFNHCIIAIKVSDAVEAPTVISHPPIGRLLIFDPTAEMTPLGDLPWHEQGSLALLVARENGALLRMPSTPPEANRLERTMEAALSSTGELQATVRELSYGQAAVDERGAFQALSRPDYTKRIERWVADGATGAKVSKIEPADGMAGGKFSLDVAFSAASYGQVMQGRLLVFKPAVVSRRSDLSLTSTQRKYPVMLDAQAYEETARIKLPVNFDVDELPDPVKLDAPFGTYWTKYEVKEGALVFTRSLVTKSATVPVEQYGRVREFFEKIRAAEQSPVVLVLK